ncbi:hypothetical protein FEM21_08470 [Flavobacterium seoulense]|uniref:Uncharacterized protein n=1 Tax=Flavobacterium seoulense TaxID=1492738 RepID=A0A066WTQ0_9FLAO|nr:hypothetical protein FEM21_08470 [Flavobacterium seoulense]
MSQKLINNYFYAIFHPFICWSKQLFVKFEKSNNLFKIKAPIVYNYFLEK